MQADMGLHQNCPLALIFSPVPV